jgi:hypothetical protein
MSTPLNLHRETYTLPGGESCRCVVDFDDETVVIMTRGFHKSFDLDDYTNFDGSMRDYAISKLEENG